MPVKRDAALFQSFNKAMRNAIFSAEPRNFMDQNLSYFPELSQRFDVTQSMAVVIGSAT